MRVLVCGGRHYGYSARLHTRGTPAYNIACDCDAADRRALEKTLDAMIADITVVIHGGASGADTLAGQWARRYATERVFNANWYPQGRSGGLDRSAGPARNQRMIDEGKPDLVLAFPGGRGTADCVGRARAAGIEVREIGM